MTEAALARARLAVFAALAAFTAANWVTLVRDPPVGRTAIAIGLAVAGAAALAAIAIRVPARWRALSLATVTIATVVIATALALGLPARLLLPSGWGELSGDLSHGLGTLGGADYPYEGGDPWSRLTLLLALAPLLALSVGLNFWPTRQAGRWRRRLGLVVLLVAYAIAATVSAPGEPLLRGALLFALIAAWIWSPTPDRGRIVASAALVGAATLLAIPIASGLDGSKPWLDYHHWNWGGTPLNRTESFDWNHTYGPLDWSRDGRTVLQVQSATPHYWATEVLDQFNGVGWVDSSALGNVDLPLRRDGSPGAPLNPKWVFRARFDVGALSSQFLVGAGTVLSATGIDGAMRTPPGISVASALKDGDSYSIQAYDPHPTPTQMRSADGPYPALMTRYTTVDVPHLGRVQPPNVTLHSRPVALTLNPVTVPLRSNRAAPSLPGLRRSPYSRVYRLARRLAANQSSSLGVVESMQRYLRSHYTYSETPPVRVFPLRAFLFRDRIGYCQQFSGALALMLRMVGIPSRVVGGFAPGQPTHGGFLVSDFDAHSWVQVYFDGIGWVTFDPTPTAAPAVSRASELIAAGAVLGKGQFGKGVKRGRPIAAGHGPTRGAGSGGGFPFMPLALLAALACAAVPIAVFVRRESQRRSLSRSALAEAQALELRAALSRFGRPIGRGATLKAIEMRLRELARPAAAGYARRLRKCRYDPASTPVPSPRERRALRRSLAAGSGIRGRLRAWQLMPPGGPAALTELRRRS